MTPIYEIFAKLSDDDREAFAAWLQYIGEDINTIADQIELADPKELSDHIVALLRLSNSLKTLSSEVKYLE